MQMVRYGALIYRPPTYNALRRKEQKGMYSLPSLSRHMRSKAAADKPLRRSDRPDHYCPCLLYTSNSKSAASIFALFRNCIILPGTNSFNASLNKSILQDCPVSLRKEKSCILPLWYNSSINFCTCLLYTSYLLLTFSSSYSTLSSASLIPFAPLRKILSIKSNRQRCV